MTKHIKSCILLLIICQMAVGQSAKWEMLFNGKNLKNWKVLNGTASFVAKGDLIIGTASMGTPNTFLATKKEYGDFILEYEMKVDPGMNSGVQIRSNSREDYLEGRVHGYQVEYDDSNRRWAGGIYDEARAGWLYSLEYNPKAKEVLKVGQWNKFRVEVVGTRIRTFINGMPVADLLVDFEEKGFIALQIHSIGSESDAGKEISWKNIRILTENAKDYMLPETSIRQVNYLKNVLSEKEVKEGWKLLWDGKSTRGWKSAKDSNFPSKGWSINDGVLTVEKSDGGESANGGDIITTERHKNFILELDFMLTEGANSGIKYFVDPDLNTGKGSAIGCEFQLLDDKVHPDAKKGISGNRTLGSLYDLIPANGQLFNENLMEKRFNGIGSWNRARIEVRGNQVTHTLNGTKIIEYERGSQMWKALVAYSKYKDWPAFGEAEAGFILLQDHGDEVSFKNIKILDLDDTF